MGEGAVERRTGWERYGWLFAAAWVPFMIFPLLHILHGGHGLLVKVLATTLLIGFAALYLWAFRHFDVIKPGREKHSQRVWVLIGLCAITVSLLLLTDLHLVGVLPFVVAWASFGMPTRWRWSVGVLVMAALLVEGVIHGWDDVLWLLAITFSLLVSGHLATLVSDKARDISELERIHLVVAERDRMARDVHDLLGHSLTVVRLKVQLAERLVDTDPERAKAELRDVQDITVEALGGVRRTVEGVRSGGFFDVLNESVAAMRAAGIAVTVDGSSNDVRGRVVIPLAWVMQELTTNILRHSKAESVTITMTPQSLSVADDGQGSEGREGNGIRGMRERLMPAGATLTARTIRGGGHRTEVTW